MFRLIEAVRNLSQLSNLTPKNSSIGRGFLLDSFCQNSIGITFRVTFFFRCLWQILLPLALGKSINDYSKSTVRRKVSKICDRNSVMAIHYTKYHTHSDILIIKLKSKGSTYRQFHMQVYNQLYIKIKPSDDLSHVSWIKYLSTMILELSPIISYTC